MEKHAKLGVQRHRIRSHVYFSATNAVQNVSVFLLALMATKKNVHATAIGKLRKAVQNALKYKPHQSISTVWSTGKL